MKKLHRPFYITQHKDFFKLLSLLCGISALLASPKISGTLDNGTELLEGNKEQAFEEKKTQLKIKDSWTFYNRGNHELVTFTEVGPESIQAAVKRPDAVESPKNSSGSCSFKYGRFER